MRKIRVAFILPVMVIVLTQVLSRCGNNQNQKATKITTASVTENTLSDEEKEAGWTLLFDGKTTKGWRNFNADTLVGWVVEDGMLVALGQGGDYANDIVTLEQFDDFELALEWKVSAGANSGIFFNALEDGVNAIYAIAPEYQIIDEENWNGKLEPWQKTGANYAMHVPNEHKKLNPTGEFNASKIVVKDSLVQHYLNGEKILEYTQWSEDWYALRNAGKWDEFPGYGTATKGHIGLQDHGEKVYFRNIKIREL